MGGCAKASTRGATLTTPAAEAAGEAVGRKRDDSRMTKVDERAVVPEVDEAARGRLAAALDEPPVVSALLFGSHAAGTAGQLSDVDVAVWLDPGLSAAERDRRQLALTNTAARALRTSEVQLL